MGLRTWICPSQLKKASGREYQIHKTVTQLRELNLNPIGYICGLEVPDAVNYDMDYFAMVKI